MAYAWITGFEWDAAKNEANQKKHGVSFDDASELLRSEDDYLEIRDTSHSDHEERFIAIGPIRKGIVLVAWTERFEGTIRIISARWATKREIDQYRRYLENR